MPTFKAPLAKGGASKGGGGIGKVDYHHNKELSPYAKKLRKEMTKEERHLWYDFLSSYPVRFLRQKVIDGYIVDFYCSKAQLVVELDGSQHYEEEALEYDKKRTEYLESIGLEVIRIPNNEVFRNFGAVCSYIDTTVNERMNPPGPSGHLPLKGKALKDNTMKTVTIYTDGACSGNPGPGGWGAILMYGAYKKELSGGEKMTTNNRMELLGVISALQALKEPCIVELWSDSKYVIDALQKGWAVSWRSKGWKKADKKPALNTDLWEVLLALTEKHEMRYHWVKGHAENPYNNRCDELAVKEREKFA